jgi:hypothetical protein
VNIESDNEQKIKELQDELLAEENRRLKEQLEKSHQSYKDLSEIVELRIQQEGENIARTILQKEAAERSAVEEAAALDRKPFVPARSDDYEVYLNASSKTKAELIRLYGAAYYEELGREYYAKKRRERDLFGNVKNKK